MKKTEIHYSDYLIDKLFESNQRKEVRALEIFKKLKEIEKVQKYTKIFRKELKGNKND